MTAAQNGSPPEQVSPDVSADIGSWTGLVVTGSDGATLGRCSETYADADTGGPEWLLVARSDGSFRIVPMAGARRSEDTVRVGYPESSVVSGPPFGALAVLTSDDETTLYEHYGLRPASNSPSATTRAALLAPGKHARPTLGALLAAVAVTVAALVFLRRRRT